MPAEILGTVDVDYSYRDGFHIFTSADIKGLYVAHRDAEAAFNGVAKAIALLLRLNEAIECKVEPSASLEDFIKMAKQATRGSELSSSHPAGLGSRTYVLKTA